MTELKSFCRLPLLVVLMPVMFGCDFSDEIVDLRQFQRSSAPNDALACPAGVCRATPDLDSPAVGLSVPQLMKRVEDVLSSEPRTELVAEDKDLPQLIFVQRSRVFGFPDTVRVQGVEAGAGAALVIHSQSNYGYWDTGANKRRLRRWLDKLSAGTATK
jgi:hypothetical protein